MNKFISLVDLILPWRVALYNNFLFQLPTVHLPLCDTLCARVHNFLFRCLCSHLFQTSMTVKRKFTTAALKQFLTAPRDPLIAHGSLDIIVQVLFEAVQVVSVFAAHYSETVLLLFRCFCCCSVFFAGFSSFISCETCCFSMYADF